MGKLGRIACIFTPFALTLASFICLIVIQISGWNKGMLPSYYFMKVNFTNLDLAASGGELAGLADSAILSTALQAVESQVADVYELHLWNYCSGDDPDGSIDYCSPRQSQYYFDPIAVWGLNATSTSTVTAPSSVASNSVVQSAVAFANDNIGQLEDQLLGSGTKDALDAYRKASKAMFILYAVAFFTTLATLVISLFAICSRWGSLCTWMFSAVSSILYIAAVGLTTGIFIALTGALKGVLDPYNVEVDLGKRVLAVGWLGVVFSWAATLFWLFGICCCSGRSNPHHKSNKGGLWNAEPKGQGYGGYGRHEKTSDYARDTSPFLNQQETGRTSYSAYQPYSAHQPAYHNGGYQPVHHG